ncbi:hypothetical protein EDB86DRAFT_827411 [Lactarius hatsudake]|nr:hypothetical protein EDB86DRAFT_827411 [Lactarius hatsudake]
MASSKPQSEIGSLSRHPLPTLSPTNDTIPRADTEHTREHMTDLDHPTSIHLLSRFSIGTTNREESVQDDAIGYPSELALLTAFSKLDVHSSESDDYGQTDASTPRTPSPPRTPSSPRTPPSPSILPPRTPSPQQRMAPAPSVSKQYSFVSLPGSAVKKRPRRRYDEIERLYNCSWAGCTKSYGTLNHLNAHIVMERHGTKRTPAEFKDFRKQWRKAKKDETERSARPDSSAGRSTMSRSSAEETIETDR